jgi:hypothetical protein
MPPLRSPANGQNGRNLERISWLKIEVGVEDTDDASSFGQKSIFLGSTFGRSREMGDSSEQLQPCHIPRSDRVLKAISAFNTSPAMIRQKMFRAVMSRWKGLAKTFPTELPETDFPDGGVR